MTDPFQMPFEEAIAYFRKKTPLPTETWKDLAGEAQDWAFTIAGLTQAQILDDIYQMTERALAEGKAFGEWKKSFKESVDRAGWTGATPWRTALIFNQNLNNAYAAGRYKQQTTPEMLQMRPYWEYRHGDSRVPRKHHLALDEKVFLANDPIWQKIYPPNGFNCRCKVFTLSQRDVDREGLEAESLSDRVTVRDRVTGQTSSQPAVKVGKKLTPVAEPGFGYTPGISEDRNQILEAALGRLHPAIADALRKAI